MRRIFVTILSFMMLLLSACGKQKTSSQESSESVLQASETDNLSEKENTAFSENFSFEGTVFHYGEQDYDVTSRVEAINSIMGAIPGGEKIIVECHVGPQNSVYCIFDINSQSFENDLIGCNLIWYDNDIKTAVYL